jgi:hypothetical protein
VCHEYGHFTKYCKKVIAPTNMNSGGEEQWKEVGKKSRNGSSLGGKPARPSSSVALLSGGTKGGFGSSSPPRIYESPIFFAGKQQI